MAKNKSTRTSKKEKFTGKEEKKSGFKPLHLLGVVFVVLLAYTFLGGSGPEAAEAIGGSDDFTPAVSDNTAGSKDTGSSSNSASSNSNQDPSSNSKQDYNNLYIQVSKINDGIAHFYEFPSKAGKKIRFFVLKSSDGIFRAAFDACDVCYREKKGYSQDGDVMVCNNCGRRFPSVKINEEKGGCNPAPLGRTMEDSEHNPVPLASWTAEGFLVIKKSDIETGAKYF